MIFTHYVVLLLLPLLAEDARALQLADMTSRRSTLQDEESHNPVFDFEKYVTSLWAENDALGDKLPDTNFSMVALQLGRVDHLAESSAEHVAARRHLGLRLLGQENDVGNSINEDVAAYASVYRKEFANRSTVFFSHISKSCGTQLCMCGWDSGCRAWGGHNIDDNCHSRGMDFNPWDAPAWGGDVPRKPVFETCEGLARYNHKHHFTLEGNENYLIHEGVCSQFWNVIVLRDPMDRVLSHFKHLSLLNEVSDKDWAQVKLGKEWSADELTPRLAFEHAPIISNNFFVRNLIGRKGYKIPFGKVTHEHLEEAKQRLADFDLVLIKSESLSDELQALLGWQCTTPVERTQKTEMYKDTLQNRWSAEEWDQLYKANELDRALFEHARQLELVDRRVFHHPRFVSAVQQECPASPHGSCGFLCK